MLKRIMFLIVIALIGTSIILAQESFDDNTILYVGQAEDYVYHIYIADIETGQSDEIATLHEFGSDAGWSADGRYVYLITYEDRKRILRLYEMGTGTIHELTDKLLANDCSTGLQWSPDGAYMFFTLTEDAEDKAALFDAENQTSISFPDLAPRPTYYEIWSPSGRYVAIPFAHPEKIATTLVWDTQTQTELVTVQADGGRLHWSDDERFFTFVQYEQLPDYRVSTAAIYDVERDIVILAAGDELGAVSADGRFGYYYDRQDTSWTLFLRDLETDTETILTESVMFTGSSTWSPDARYMLYSEYEEGLTNLNLLEPASEKSIVLMSEVPLIRRTMWSPNSDLIAIVYVEEGMKESENRLALYSVSDSTMTTYDFFIPNIYYSATARWSPDGKLLAVRSVQGSLIVNPENNASIDLNQWADTQYSGAGFWSKDGRYLLFFGKQEDGTTYYIYDVATHDAIPLEGIPPQNTFIGWRGTNHNNSLIDCGEG